MAVGTKGLRRPVFIDKPDEEVREGSHQVPTEVRELWLRCQDIKQERTKHKEGRPRALRRAYPFSRVAVCERCGLPFGGQPVHRRGGEVIRRLYHRRPFCALKPHSVRVEHLMAQFQEGVLPYISLEQEWRQAITGALYRASSQQSTVGGQATLQRARENLRKLFIWCDISDDDYHRQKQALEQELHTLTGDSAVPMTPDLDRAALLLTRLPALWQHPGVDDHQREEFLREVFMSVRLEGGQLVAVEPNPLYQPIFAYAVSQGVRMVGASGFEPPTPCTPCRCATGLRYAPTSVAYHLPHPSARARPPFSTS